MTHTFRSGLLAAGALVVLGITIVWPLMALGAEDAVMRFRYGGFWMLPLLVAACLSPIVIATIGTVDRGGRAPLPLHFAAPFVVVATGCGGWMLSMGKVTMAAASADSADATLLFLAGSAEAGALKEGGLVFAGLGLLLLAASGILLWASEDGDKGVGAVLFSLGALLGPWAIGRGLVYVQHDLAYEVVSGISAHDRAFKLATHIESAERIHTSMHLAVGVGFALGLGLLLASRKAVADLVEGRLLGLVAAVVLCLLGVVFEVETSANHQESGAQIMGPGVALPPELQLPSAPANADVGFLQAESVVILGDRETLPEQPYNASATWLAVRGDLPASTVLGALASTGGKRVIGLVVDGPAVGLPEEAKRRMESVGMLVPPSGLPALEIRLWNEDRVDGDVIHMVLHPGELEVNGKRLSLAGPLVLTGRPLVVHVAPAATAQDLVNLLARRKLEVELTPKPPPVRAPPAAVAEVEPLAVRVVLGKSIILGSLDKEIIRRVLREKLATVRACYAGEIEKASLAGGKLVMKWVIDGQGKVAQAKVAQGFEGGGDLGACVARAIRGWRFPKPKGGGIAIVNQPFVFGAR